MSQKIEKLHHPHNNLFEKCAKLKEVMASMLSLTSLAGQLDNLSFKKEDKTWIDEMLKKREGDSLYSVKWENSKSEIYILMEHKSSLEDFFVQVFCYLGLAYYQQKMDIIAENNAREDKQNTPPKPIRLKPIIIVILYHGITEYKEMEFADMFDLPDPSLRQYIPTFQFIFLNLPKIPDEKLFNLGNSLASAMLLLFKHRGNKEFLKQNSKKIFKFVEEDTYGNLTDDVLTGLVLYIYQIYDLEPEEVQEIIPNLPPKAQKEMRSTFDLIEEKGIQIGEERGIQIGEERGIQIGENITEIKQKLEFTLVLLKKFSHWTDEEIAETVKVSEKIVQKARKKFNKNKKEKIIKFTHKLFGNIPNLKEKEMEKLEKWAIEQWKNFKKEKK